MQPIKKFLEQNFRIKVLLPMIAVMVVMLALTVWFVEYHTQLQVERGAREALRGCDATFRQLQINHQNNLQLRLQLLANEPKYIATFMTLDFKTITNQLARLLEEKGFPNPTTNAAPLDFVLFTPEIAPEESEPMIQPASVARSIVAQARQSVKNSLEAGNLNDVVVVNGTLYSLISVRVLTPQTNYCGLLTYGEQINSETIGQEYGKFTKKAVAFIAANRLGPTSFAADTDTSKFESLFDQLAVNSTESVLKTTIGKKNYFCSAGTFDSSQKQMVSGYLLFSLCDPLDNIVRTQQLLLVITLVGILIGSVLVLVIVNKVTQPLRELHAAAEAAGRGDYSHRVSIRTKDEFGQLAHAFNQMNENIELSQSKLKQTVETLKTTQSQLIQSEKLSAVGEFVAGVAHELNNPLAAVLGFSEMLKHADVGEKHARHLDLIYKSAERCKKIVQSLLSFARRQQPERKPQHVNQLIEDVLEMIAYPLRTSNVKVITQFSAKLPIVLADGHQVQQVVLNLVNNARQAIESAAGSGCITISTQHEAQVVRIIIQDNGPGIAPENLKRIFDPFFTTKEVGQGTGLGLSLCYGMIHEHGGNILATSQPGEGATFTIELPVADEAAWFETSFITKTATSPAQKDLREGAGKKILCVDDEESLLHLIKEELVQHSYEVITAANGETALRELRSQTFDAIICDLKMPGLNGRQVYEKLRVENPAASRRMVFVTGDIIGDQLRKFLETEKRPCLTKPFSLADLRQAVKTQLAEL